MTRTRTLALLGEGVGPALGGGKGAALDRLIGLGLNVPTTGVITADGYHSFVSDSGLLAWLSELRRSALTSAADLEEAADEVDARFLAAPMSASLRAEIAALADEVRQGGLLAIRSSATAEDLASASFAGQYRSLLEIGDDDAVERAVRLVWASLWHPSPRAYRAHRDVDESDLAMAVVVMRMVDAHRAGVVFTTAPGGAPGQLRIEAVDGLAEQLVSGDVTPEAYEIARQAARRTTVDPLVAEVADLAMFIERSWGQPVDVEWAHDGHELFVVQARPITTLANTTRIDPFDTAIGREDTYTTAGVAEMLPGVLPPLQWTTVAPLLEEGFRALFEQMGALPETADHTPFMARIRGRATLSLDLMREAARMVPGGSAQELERQYFGRVVSSDEEATQVHGRGPFQGLRNMARGAREISARRRFRFEANATIETIRAVTADPPELDPMSDDELLAYRHRLLDLAGRAVAAEVAVAAAAAAAYRGIELFLEPRLGVAEAALAAQKLTAGGIQPCGTQLALNTCLLTALAMVDETVAEILVELDDIDLVRQRLEELPAGRKLLDNFRAELQQAGSAAVFAGATWAESEDLAWQLLRQSTKLEQLQASRGLESAERLARLRGIQDRFGTSLKYKVQRALTGQVVDVRKRMLRRLVFDAVEFLEKRETTKSAVLKLGGEVRRVHLDVGRRLHARTLLPAALDIDLLDALELADALAGAGISAWELDRRRAELDAVQSNESLPQVFTGDPDRSLAVAAVGGDYVEGWAASAGRYEGIARVITKPTEPIAAGEILVARTTDPSWTPLFLTAGAIVVEEGGPLSHAAIIARELGLPAVLNVPGLIDRLGGSGATIVVDGDAGTVAIVDDAARVSKRTTEAST